ncbi:hypothetical protein O0I10_012654 [Lichtheimia ornata]|uniref:Integrase catalytic domain-containing protein n=1 Tax=Lichtheimia ornata TaxID=688661 RepID=A0AAD7UQM4_9FUNG|nr:uncharacterized protein O0I10_012654 [Lichtheimia ornata]KAJ8651777.1 hypothetical protein O0I10_012654 [Lichtheimia ornata]
MTSNEQSIFFGRERNWLSKATFGRLMEQYIANPKSSDSKTIAKTNKPKAHDKTFISKDMYDDMKRVLKGESLQHRYDRNFSWWTRKAFVLKTLPSGESFIVRKDDGTKNANKTIAIKEHLYDIITDAHETVGHGRRDAMRYKLNEYMYCPTRFINLVLNHCSTCAMSVPGNEVKTAGKALHADAFMTRLQMDLIDYGGSRTPTGEMRYILHVKDHRTKYGWAYPLPSKEAYHVGERLHELFCQVGPPKELQSDNGGEFKDVKMLTDLQSKWPTTLIYGSPRHPETQGLIERANRTLKKKLSDWVQDQRQDGNDVHWTEGLSQVVYGINITFSRPIKTTPYRMVYGQDPHPHGPSILQHSQDPNDVDVTQGDTEGHVSDISMPNDDENDATGDQGTVHAIDNDDDACDGESTNDEECRSGDASDIEMDAASPITMLHDQECETGDDRDTYVDDASPIIVEDEHETPPDDNGDKHTDDANLITIEDDHGKEMSEDASDAYSDWNGFDYESDNEVQDMHPSPYMTSKDDPTIYDDFVIDMNIPQSTKDPLASDAEDYVDMVYDDEYAAMPPSPHGDSTSDAYADDSDDTSSEELMNGNDDSSSQDGYGYYTGNDTESNQGTNVESDSDTNPECESESDTQRHSEADDGTAASSRSEHDFRNRHLAIREAAGVHYDKSVQNIQNWLNKMADKVPEYKVGDIVGVPIENVHQLKNGARYLPAIIYKVSFGQGDYPRYKVCCAHGAITRSFHGREMRNFAGITFHELHGVDHALVNDATTHLTVKEAVVLNDKKLKDSLADNSRAIEECDQDDNDAFTNTNNTTTHVQKPRPRTQKQTRNLKPVAPRRITRAMTRLNTRSRTHARQKPY